MTENNDCKVFYDRLEKAGLDKITLANRMGVKRITIYSWLYSNQIPLRHYFNIQAICKQHKIAFPKHLFTKFKELNNA